MHRLICPKVAQLRNNNNNNDNNNNNTLRLIYSDSLRNMNEETISYLTYGPYIVHRHHRRRKFLSLPITGISDGGAVIAHRNPVQGQNPTVNLRKRAHNQKH